MEKRKLTPDEFKEVGKTFWACLNTLKKISAQMYAETENKAISDTINMINEVSSLVVIIPNSETVEIYNELKTDDNDGTDNK